MSLPSFLGCSSGRIFCLPLPFCPLTDSPRTLSPGSVLCPCGCEMQVAADGLDFSFMNGDLRNCFISHSSWEFRRSMFVWGSLHRADSYQTLAFQLIQHDYSRRFCLFSPLDVYGLLYCAGSFFFLPHFAARQEALAVYTQCNQHGSVTAALD